VLFTINLVSGNKTFAILECYSEEQGKQYYFRFYLPIKPCLILRPKEWITTRKRDIITLKSSWCFFLQKTQCRIGQYSTELDCQLFGRGVRPCFMCCKASSLYQYFPNDKNILLYYYARYDKNVAAKPMQHAGLKWVWLQSTIPITNEHSLWTLIFT